MGANANPLGSTGSTGSQQISTPTSVPGPKVASLVTFAVIPGDAGSAADEASDGGDTRDVGEPILCLQWRSGRAPVSEERLDGLLLSWTCHDGLREGVDLTPLADVNHVLGRLAGPRGSADGDAGLLAIEVTEDEGVVRRYAMRVRS